jgi:hypothetical protein
VPAPQRGDKDAIVARFKDFARRHRLGRPGLKALREEGRL